MRLSDSQRGVSHRMCWETVVLTEPMRFLGRNRTWGGDVLSILLQSSAIFPTETVGNTNNRERLLESRRGDNSKKFEMKGSPKKRGDKVGEGRREGGAVGGRLGRRGQRRGQIYFLPTMVLDDGPLSGHCGLRQSGNPQEKRPKGQPSHLHQWHTPFFRSVCACGRVGLQFHFSAGMATDILVFYII